MAWTPISNTVPQYAKNSGGTAASGYYLKFYAGGTTTPINMATDSTGGTTLARCQLNSLGYPINGSGDVFIPHIDQDYKLALYENATDSDNNTLASAAWVVDNLEPGLTIGTTDFVKLTDLSASTGSSLSGYISDQTGAIARTLQSRGRDTVSIIDFGGNGDGVTSNNAAFTLAESASATEVWMPEGTYIVTGLTLTKNYVGPGVIQLDSKNQFNDKPKLFRDGAGPRQHLRYKSATEVYVPNASAIMSGFRFQGMQTKTEGPKFDSGAANPLLQSVSTVSDQGVFTSNEDMIWYGVFACANDGDSSYVLKVMPFFRVQNSSGSSINLGDASEAGNPSTLATYAMNANSLAGSDALLITESSVATVDSRHKWYGKIVGVSSNTASAITFDEDVSELGEGDFLLCSPPGYTYYRYMSSFYSDVSNDVRNFADDGRQVKSRGIDVTITDGTGAASNINGENSLTGTGGRYIQFISHIPPLATSAIIREKCSYSTASTGFALSNLDHDGLIGTGVGHPVHLNTHNKQATVSTNPSWSGVELPFSFRQRYRYYTSTSALEASRSSATIQVQGWVEP